MNKFSKAAGYKSNTLKSIVFVHICNKQFESEIKKTIQFNQNQKE